MTGDWLSTKQAMDLLGVGPTTVKRWTDEGMLPAIRTTGGHRRFKRSDLLRFREQVLAAQTEINAVDEEVDLISLHTSVADTMRNITALRGSFGDCYQFADYMGRVFEKVGDRWETGEVSVAEEHLTSGRLLRAIEMMTESNQAEENSPVCILATLSGERHTLGLALVELCMREAGYQTIWLGAETPTESLCDLIERIEPRVVTLSGSSWSSDRRFLATSYQRVVVTCQKLNIELIIGGSAPWPVDLEYGCRCESFTDLGQIILGLDESNQDGHLD